MADSAIYVVDAGNTRLKVARFEKGAITDWVALPLSDWRNHRLPMPAQQAALSSVSLPEADLAAWLRAQGVPKVLVFDQNSALPFESLYSSPHTLGSDRKMLITGANQRFPQRNRLIISLGSCITYDLLDAANRHLGGDISPGLHMRWQAMHQFTQRLPLVSLPTEPAAFGTDTISALQSGGWQGMLAEIEGRIAQFEKILPDLTIILSGGDAHFFEKQINSRIFAEPNLALYGLHALLED
jgi:type III pantothenate kinase